MRKVSTIICILVFIFLQVSTTPGDDNADAKVLYDKAIQLITTDQIKQAVGILKGVIAAYPNSGSAQKAKKLLSGLANPNNNKQKEVAPIDENKVIETIGRFNITKCGSIIDTKYELEWFVGPNENVSWAQASEYAKNLKKCGDNWRMPRFFELRALKGEYIKHNARPAAWGGDVYFDLSPYHRLLGQSDMSQMQKVVKMSKEWAWSDDIYVDRAYCASMSINHKYDLSLRQFSDNVQALAVRVPTHDLPRVKGSYKVHKCGMIEDISTGLQWFIGPEKNMNWSEAFMWANSLESCGSNWRLPKSSELEGLFKNGLGYRSISPVFHTIGRYVWSSEMKNKKKAWAYIIGTAMCRPVKKINDDFAFMGGIRAFAVRNNK